jgi:uncharacterized protein
MIRNTIKLWLVIIAGTHLLAGCNRNTTQPETYREEIEAWKEKRISNLKARDGWLNLAGLYWLQEGMNTFGSDSSNNLVFPLQAPAFIGVFERKGDSIYLLSTTVPVLINGIPSAHLKIRSDASGSPDMMTVDSLAWFVIKRNDKYGVRLRDFNNPMIDSLTGIPCFETNDRWRITAAFKPYSKPEKHLVKTIIGTVEENLVPGELHFRVSGKKLTLYPFVAEHGFFLVFGDETNGSETYPAGRFLYTNAPDTNNQVIIDFNKAYNPPCAFTPYATCPLPLRKNILPIAIEAGEKTVHLFNQLHQ